MPELPDLFAQHFPQPLFHTHNSIYIIIPLYRNRYGRYGNQGNTAQQGHEKWLPYVQKIAICIGNMANNRKHYDTKTPICPIDLYLPQAYTMVITINI